MVYDIDYLNNIFVVSRSYVSYYLVKVGGNRDKNPGPQPQDLLHVGCVSEWVC